MPHANVGAPLTSEGKSRRMGAAIAIAAIVGVWLAAVVFTASRHEFWRDEVRALSLARAASSPLDLYQLVQYDGHPVLWHLLLYIGTSIVDTPLVLPITSIVVAFSAVALFMVSAPFPSWFRCLFIFSALVFYEYSVMARNYGISMLLLFVAAILYRQRTRHPFLLAFALALLANTNVHSAMFACLAAALWAWDIAIDQKVGTTESGLSRYLPLAMVIAGVLVCAAFAMPRENTILTSVRQSLSVSALVDALRGAVLRPDETFADLVPVWLRPKAAILLLYGAVFGLWTRPHLFLAALAAQIGLGVFFRVAYPGWYRHQGLYLVFLVFLYWLFIESAGRRGRRTVDGFGRGLFRGGLYAALLLLILVDVSKAPRIVRADITGARSSSRSLGEFLIGSAEYREAVIVPEPDFMLESLPYYAGNAIYLPRERRFSTTVSWTTDSRLQLSISELLRDARAVQTRTGKAVLIVLGSMNPERDPPGESKSMYGKVFTWSAAELDQFRDSTTFVVEFSASEGDEDYRVYALRR
jgi:hypothetical protein